MEKHRNKNIESTKKFIFKINLHYKIRITHVKNNKTATIKREEGNSSCTHCKKNGHDDEHCWKLHPEKRHK